MGVSKVSPVITRYAANARLKVCAKDFKGKRVAIDASYWLYSNYSIIYKQALMRIDIVTTELHAVQLRKQYFTQLINFIMRWLSHGVTPVFIFDGKPPAEKIAVALTKRTDKKTKQKLEIDTLHAQASDPLMVNPSILDKLRKALRSHNDLPRDEIDFFRQAMQHLGVPCLHARGEADQLAAMLAIDGYVAAVYTKDTDMMAYGTPLMLTNWSDTHHYENGQRIDQLDAVRMDAILCGLKLSLAQFVDLCIGVGCDYNTNMPGNAGINVYKLIQTYGSIDYFPLDTKCLNHRRVRQLFSYVPSAELVQQSTEDIDSMAGTSTLVNIDLIDALGIDLRRLEQARFYMETAGVESQLVRLREGLIYCMSGENRATNGTVTTLGLIPIPKYEIPKYEIPQVPIIVLSPTSIISSLPQISILPSPQTVVIASHTQMPAVTFSPQIQIMAPQIPLPPKIEILSSPKQTQIVIQPYTAI